MLNFKVGEWRTTAKVLQSNTTHSGLGNVNVMGTKIHLDSYVSRCERLRKDAKKLE